MDKSQIGCYIKHNERLIDVMVLSDSNYHIKIPISVRAQDDDKIILIFKRLAASEDEEPLGNKNQDNFIIGQSIATLGAYRTIALNQVCKRWLSLLGSSTRQNIDSDATYSPRALVYFYYGEKTVGTAAIEEALTLGVNDESSSPFKQANKSSRYSVPSNNRDKSAEKRSVIDQTRSRYGASKFDQSADGLTAYSSEKPSMIMDTKPQQNGADNGQYLLPSKMPKELRQDPEIAGRLQELEKASKAYLSFDMNRLEQEMNRELEGQIGRMQKEYGEHQQKVKEKLDRCEELNEHSHQIKAESVKIRYSKQKALQDISQKTLQFDQQFNQDNQAKHQLRQTLGNLEKRLRELQRDLASTDLENSALKALLGGESELREDRRHEETYAFLAVNDDLKQSYLVAEEEKRKFKKQHEVADQQVATLDKLTLQSKRRVEELLEQLKSAKDSCKDQLERMDTECKALIQENRQLKLTKEKNDAKEKQLKKEFDQLVADEKLLQQEWNRKVNELEASINSKQAELQEVISQLAEVQLELGQLKVQTQTTQYKSEYQQSLKEMYEAHGYDNRLRKLNTEVEQSQKKAQMMEEELERINEQWTNTYEEAVRGLRERIEEMGNQAQLEMIQKLMAQAAEKDQIVAGLTDGINELKADLRKMHSSDEELSQAKRALEERFKQYRRALNEKAILYDQMLISAKQLINRDELILKNEEDLLKCKYEVDISKLELEQKREMVDELELQLSDVKTKYKDLKLEIKRFEKKTEQLTNILKQKEDELEQLEEILRERDNIIDELEKQLGQPEPVPVPIPPKPELKKQWYKPVKGDLVDELMAKYLNDMQCLLPVKRLGDGFYMFGTKKIYAKIMQGKLVIRVGGGFMSVEEFIKTYAEFEVQKVQQLIERGLFNLDDYGNTEFFNIEVSPSKNLKKRLGSGSPKRDGSPRI